MSLNNLLKVLLLSILFLLVSCSSKNGNINTSSGITNTIINNNTKDVIKNIEKEIVNNNYNEDKSLLKITEDGILIRDNSGAIIFRGDFNNLTIKNSNNKEILGMVDGAMRVFNNDRKRVIEMGDVYGIQIYKNNNRIFLMLNDRTEIKSGFEDVIKFGKSLKIGKNFSIGEDFKIGDRFTFTDNSLIIGNFEFTDNGVFKNGKKIRSINSLKISDNVYINKDKISFGKNSYITRKEIKFKKDLVNLDKISTNKDIYINKKGEVKLFDKTN